jgi:hypothetical protein
MKRPLKVLRLAAVMQRRYMEALSSMNTLTQPPRRPCLAHEPAAVIWLLLRLCFNVLLNFRAPNDIGAEET